MQCNNNSNEQGHEGRITEFNVFIPLMMLNVYVTMHAEFTRARTAQNII